MSPSENSARQYLETHNCAIPGDRYYDTVKHQWILEEDDGALTVGLSDVGQTAVGKLLHLNIKKVGTQCKAQKSIATYEAAKWIGAINMPFPVTIVEHNPAVMDDLFLINQLPYTTGWMVRFRPQSPVTLGDHFVRPEEAHAVYASQLDEGKLEDCVHCLDFEV